MTEHNAPQHFETQQIHAGSEPDPTTGSRATPIYQTTAYVFRDADHAARLFALEEPGNIYSRIMNPTVDVLEKRVAALEGGVAALAVASGQAAESFAVLNILEAGDHLVASSNLYGGTYNLFKHTLPRLGIETTFVTDQADLDAWRAAVRPNTKAFFAETITNPGGEILDIQGISEIAHENHVPLIVDNTIATPYLIQPLSHGADIVVHSATKFLGGHGTTIAGVIVDGGTFEWSKAGKFDRFTTPDESYNNIVFTDAVGDQLAYITKARVALLRDLGAALSAQAAWNVIIGIETLSLRMERHTSNAQKIAEWLEKRDDVHAVYYAGLASSPSHAAAERYAPRGAGAIVSFELAGGEEAGRNFVGALDLFSHLANIGDVRSLVVHPASTTHAQLSPEQRLEAGVTPGLVRLSVGIENVDDLIADLEQGFERAASVTDAAATH